MGLTHPDDLRAWHRWQERRRPWPSRVKGSVRALLGDSHRAHLTLGGPRPRLLVALDAVKATTITAQLAPLQHWDKGDVAVLSPAPVRDRLPGHSWVERSGPLDRLVMDVVHEETLALSTGHYLPVGAATRAALADPARFVTVQHGLLTPDAPPLAEQTTVLAWSEQDGEFWRSGRGDVAVRSVGSQLLWDAAGGGGDRSAHDPTPEPADGRPLYLGQLHGSEFPRAALEEAARDFCREHDATYRPHPSETDRASVDRHRAWKADGIRIDRSGTPLTEVAAPVVSVYSTGVLEAAARGRSAWVAFPEPPAWLTDFWGRYAMSEWGGPPTAAPALPAVEPARAVATALLELLGETP